MLLSLMSLTLMTVTSMYVWKGNGKRYVKQRRSIASIDDRTDGNNRPNKRNRTIDILMMMRIVMTTMIVTTITTVMMMLILTTMIVTMMIHTIMMMMMIGTECLSTTICKTLRRCSRCTEAIRNGASIDPSHSEWCCNHMMVMFPTAVDWMKARQGKARQVHSLLLVMREPLRKRGVEW